MNGYGIAAAIAAWSFLATRLLIGPVRRRNLARGRVDRPGGRKNQSAPVPYGGGEALYLGVLSTVVGGLLAAVLVGIFVADRTGTWVRHVPGLIRRAPQIAALFLGTGAMLLTGRLDDARGLPVLPRFLVQLGAAALMAWAGPRITLFIDSTLMHLAMTTVWIVLVTNACNFIDNMDGLLPGTALAAAASFAGIAAADGQLFVAALGLALAGGLLAVFLENRRPARIYLGDEGSMATGFLLAVLTVTLSFRSESANGIDRGQVFWAPFLVLAVPLADAVVAVGGRLRRGEAPWKAGHDHLSHRLARRAGLGAAGAVRLLLGTSFLAGSLALASYGLDPLRSTWALALALTAVACFLRVRRGDGART